MAQDPFTQYAVPDADPFAAFVEQTPPPPRSTSVTPVAASEPGTWWGGAVKGFQEGAANSWPARFLQGANAHPAETGAIIGSLAAVPFTGGASLLPAVAAAGLGGAGGAGLGMLAGAAGGSPNIPATSGGVLRTMGMQGAIQAGAEGGGRLIGAALQRTAPSLYRMGTGQTPAMRREFPNAAARGVQEGVIPTPGRVRPLLAQAERQTQAAVRGYDAANPAAVDPLVLSGQAAGQAIDQGRIAARGIHTPGLNEVGDLSSQVIAENPAPLTLGRTLDLKRAEEVMAGPAYRAAEKGRQVSDEERLFHKGLADASRNVVRTRVPEAATQLQREQDLIGLLQGAERPAPSGLRHILAAGIVGGTLTGGGHPLVGLGTAAAIEGIRNPYIMGGAGIGWDRLGRAIASPTARRVAMLAALTGHDGP